MWPYISTYKYYLIYAEISTTITASGMHRNTRRVACTNAVSDYRTGNNLVLAYIVIHIKEYIRGLYIASHYISRVKYY